MATLTEATRDELLIRMDERLGNLIKKHEDFEVLMNSDEGPARCQLHKKDIDDLAESFKWPKRAAVGAAVGVVIKVIWDGLRGFFTM